MIAELGQTHSATIFRNVVIINILIDLGEVGTLEATLGLKTKHAPDATDGIPHHGDRIGVRPVKVVRDGQGTAEISTQGGINSGAAIIILVIDAIVIGAIRTFGETGGGDGMAHSTLSACTAIDPTAETRSA